METLQEKGFCLTDLYIKYAINGELGTVYIF